MKTRLMLVLLALAPLMHTAAAQQHIRGIDGTDLLRAQQAAINDTRPTPPPLHDLTASATEFAVWNFITQAYDTLRFVRHAVPDIHPDGWGRSLRLWVEEADLQSGRITKPALDSLAWDIGLNLSHVMWLSWGYGRPAHIVLDSLQGTDILLLDIRDGYDPDVDDTWLAGFMDRCDTKGWVPEGCPQTGGGNQANMLYIDTWPQLHTDPVWAARMIGWLYGRRVSSVWGPRKLPLLEYGGGRLGRVMMNSRAEHNSHPDVCAALLRDTQASALDLAAPAPHPRSRMVHVLQDRGALFVDFMDFQAWTRRLMRTAADGSPVRPYTGWVLPRWMLEESGGGWELVDTIVRQWNTTPSDSLMKEWGVPGFVPYHPPDGLASRDDLVFTFHEANYRGWKYPAVFIQPRWGLCHPAMGSRTGSIASSDAFTLGRGAVRYIDLSAFTRPFSFTLDRQDVQDSPAKVQAGVIYYEHGDTLTQRMGWLDPDSAAAWPWSLPDTVASKDLAALLLVMGTEGEPPTLTYTVAAPVAAMQDEPALAYTLEQNYPNPFHAGTTVRYALPRSGRVRLSVYDLLGREVAVVEDGIVAAGTHERRLDASKWASGIYHYRLATPVGSTSRQMVLAR